MAGTKVSSKAVSQRLANRLANFKLKDEVIAKLADRILIDGLDLGKFYPCIYGICVDYFTPKVPRLDGIFSKLDVSKVDVFPYGIIEWDRFRVQVGFEVDGLEGHFRADLGVR